MKATYCDRCGERVTAGGKIKVAEVLPTRGISGEHDLCDECLDDWVKWMEEK